MTFEPLALPKGHRISVSVADAQWIRIQRDDALLRALENLGNLVVARAVKGAYRRRWGEEIHISDASLAIEITGHALPDAFAEEMLAHEIPAVGRQVLEKLRSHTEVIDCGESDVDGNRFIWDMLAPTGWYVSEHI